MPDADYRAEQDAFVEGLKRALRAAGGPSYGQLELLAARMPREHSPGGVRYEALPRSSTSEILNGRRKHALRWPWVMTFVTVLREVARRGGIDVAEVGSVDEWKLKYEAVLAARQDQPRAGRAGGRRRSEVGGVSVMGLAGTATAAAGRDRGSAEPLPGLVRGVAPQWRRGCRDLAPEWLELYLRLESLGGLIRTYQTTDIPRLLQTEAYCRALIAWRRPDATPREIACHVDRSMRRRSLRGPESPRPLWAVVEEAALSGRRVGARVMRAQVEHLLDLADEPGVVLQIVRAGDAGNLTLSGPMTIFSLPEPNPSEVVFLEKPDPALFLYRREDTDQYKRLFDSLSCMASEPRAAKDELGAILRGI